MRTVAATNPDRSTNDRSTCSAPAGLLEPTSVEQVEQLSVQERVAVVAAMFEPDHASRWRRVRDPDPDASLEERIAWWNRPIRDRERTSRVLGGDESAWITIAPGLIRLRTGAVEDWELTDRDHYDQDEEQGTLWVDHQSPESTGTKAPIAEWSAKSRLSMLRTMAMLDWTPFIEAPGDRRAALVTLTYPADWEAVAPDGATVKRHLRMFQKAFERQYGQAQGAWKLEFQRRGAPHLHLWLLVPWAKQGNRTTDEWISTAWARIVAADDTVVCPERRTTERQRHLAAGTNIDFGWSTHCTDPARIAGYFAKHNAPSKDSSKEYQHSVPESWSEPGRGPGRFWGVWRLERAAVEVEISEQDAIDASRILRKWNRQRGITKRKTVKRTNRRTGEIKFRQSTVRLVMFGPPNAHNRRSVLTNDGPGLAFQVARALRPPPGHVRGTSRNLP